MQNKSSTLLKIKRRSSLLLGVVTALNFLASSNLFGSAGAPAGGTARELIVPGLMYDLGPILQAKTIDLTLLSDMQKLLYLGGYSDNVVAIEAMLLTLGSLDQTSLPITYELCLLYDLPTKLQLLIDAIDYFKKSYFMNQLQGLLANPVVNLDHGERMNFSIGLEEGDYIALINRIRGYLKDKISNIGYLDEENINILNLVLAEYGTGSSESLESEVDAKIIEKVGSEANKSEIIKGDYLDLKLTPEEIAFLLASEDPEILLLDRGALGSEEAGDDGEGVEESKSFEKIDENNLVELERFLYELFDPQVRFDYTQLLAEDFDTKKAFYQSIVNT